MAVREWFAGKEILLTGVTSDLGNAVLDKLLRSCPDIKTIYVVLRTWDGLTKENRIKRILESAGFERVRQESPDAIARIKTLEGNLVYDDLALTADQMAIIKNVSVVIHAGGPAHALLELCCELPALSAAAIAESFFKREGRNMKAIQDEITQKFPLALIRIPAIGPALKEPMPGNINVLNGATALMVGAGYALGNPDFPAAILPVDLAANMLITSAWDKGMRSNDRTMTIYNAPPLGRTWAAVIKSGSRASKTFPYPSFGIRGMTTRPWLHSLVVLLLEWLPSVLCDAALLTVNGKPRIVNEHVRIRMALQSVEPILSRSWISDQNNVCELKNRLTPEDQEDFVMQTDFDLESYVLCAAAGVKRACANDNNGSVITNFKRMLLLIAVGLLVILYIR